MDRRQRKTREAIFAAFSELIAEKNFGQITVGQIIDRADVGRATFYAHFETKDFLLKEFCRELFCHIFDAANKQENGHRHIFHCDESELVFLHLFQHIAKNDNHILALLSGENNDLFLNYFRSELEILVESQLSMFASRKHPELPLEFWKDHIAATFIETLRWWIHNGMEQTPEQINGYFMMAV